MKLPPIDPKTILKDMLALTLIVHLQTKNFYLHKRV